MAVHDGTVGYGQLSAFDLDDFERLMSARNDWFAADLVRLIAKADRENRERLRAGFPGEVAAFERWYATGDPH